MPGLNRRDPVKAAPYPHFYKLTRIGFDIRIEYYRRCVLNQFLAKVDVFHYLYIRETIQALEQVAFYEHGLISIDDLRLETATIIQKGNESQAPVFAAK